MIHDLFSKRQKRLRGEVPDIYVYDQLPEQLRVQVIHIIKDFIDIKDTLRGTFDTVYAYINSVLCREYGLFTLTEAKKPHDALFNFFMREPSVERCLDIIELTFQLILLHRAGGIDRDPLAFGPIPNPDNAIEELNGRFKEHGIGYQFEPAGLIRVDSQFIHAEVVKPTLKILRGQYFQGAGEEFLKAHEHYRHGRTKECLVDSLKAFESTMKAICAKRRWAVDPKATAKDLIRVCFDNGLIPPYLESEFSSFRLLLESGVPTVRNKTSGHGQGTTPVTVPEYLARYGLNLTAANILFLAEAEAALP